VTLRYPSGVEVVFLLRGFSAFSRDPAVHFVHTKARYLRFAWCRVRFSMRLKFFGHLGHWNLVPDGVALGFGFVSLG
jgi:hypothetical protein